jgi:tetratricopeptide (TPR) repeat protein
VEAAATPASAGAHFLKENMTMTTKWRLALCVVIGLVVVAAGARGVMALTQTSTHASSSGHPGSVAVLPSGAGVASAIPPNASTDALIRRAQAAVRANPSSVQAYTDLALAYMQKERETTDVTYYTLTDEALKAALRLDPANYTALSYGAWVAMGRHDFVAAARLARQAIRANPYDPNAYANLGDAEANLGDYTAMSRAYQKMVNLKPSLASYDRASYTRYLYGDLRAAYDFMRMAINAGSTVPENVAWAETQLGNEYMSGGYVTAAQYEYRQALRSFPHYAQALAGLALVDFVLGKSGHAVAAYKQAIAVVPLPQYVIGLGDLYARLGDTREATQEYALVRFILNVFRINHVQYDIELAQFYADHDQHLSDALRLAESTARVRHDTYTEDTLAWVLYKLDRYGDAQRAEMLALRLGTKEGLYYFHAGMIEAKLGHVEGAQAYLSDALMLNPNFSLLYAPVARAELTRLAAAGAVRQTHKP